MSEFGGLWNHKNNQHARVPPKTERNCPSGGGIKNGHIRYPSPMDERRKKKRKCLFFFKLIKVYKYYAQSTIVLGRPTGFQSLAKL